MNKILEIDKNTFESHSQLLPHIVQSSLWAEFKKRTSNSTIYYFAESDEAGTIVAEWMMYTRKVPYIGGKIGVITQCLPPSSELLGALSEIAKRDHIRFVMIEPLLEDSEEHKKELKKLGLVKGADYFLPHTFILDLTSSLELPDIFAKFSSSTRRNIRIAEKKEVKIKKYLYAQDDYTHIDRFLSIQEETVKRHTYAVHTNHFFHTLYDTLKNNLLIFEAEYEGEVIASMIAYVFNDSMYYPHGASLHKYIDTKSSNLLLYTSIADAFSQKYTKYNFWGALSADPSPKDPLYGVHQFKKGFGGTLHEYVGAYDLIIDKAFYSAFTHGYTMYWKGRKLLRKLKR
jgi:peptidoglycan pentaglycine glycine transferase (the first glycine)